MEAKYNPWNVLSLEAFHFYNCPECDDKYATREQFVGHAMIVHEKAQATLPTILKNNLVISNVHSIQDKETEGCNDTEFELESSICIEKVEPMIDTELDGNDVQHESDIERVENHHDSNNETLMIEISQQEKTFTEEHLENCKRTVKGAFKVKRKKIYKCKECEKYFCNKQHLTQHVQRAHEGAPFKCVQCPKTYTSKGGLQVHIKIVHEGLTFKCDQCSKICNSSTGLRTHIQRDHDGLTFNCDQCSKTYISSTGLYHHIKSVHECLSDYKCEQCCKVFSTKDYKKEHFKAVHQGVLFKCDQCPRTYNSNMGLRDHIKSIHEGVTYKCKRCRKAFKQSHNLKKHIRLKHKNPK